MRNNPINSWDPFGLKFTVPPDPETRDIVKKAFEYLNQTRTGRFLLQKIQASSFTVKIIFNPDGKNSAEPAQKIHAGDGKGTNSVVSWNGNDLSGLVHELTHAYRHITGTRKNGDSTEIDPDTGKETLVATEELQSTGLGKFEGIVPSENSYREDTKRSKRLTYTNKERTDTNKKGKKNTEEDEERNKRDQESLDQWLKELRKIQSHYRKL